jgi:4-hydroxyphenylacetate 3-monooxygenase
MVYRDDDGEPYSIGLKLPYSQNDWSEKRASTDAIFDDIGGVVTRVGDETVGEMWSLYDGQDVLNQVDPQFSKNIKNHIHKVIDQDPFMFRQTPIPRETGRKRHRIRIQTCYYMS